MYNNLITSETVKPSKLAPFQSNDLISVLKQKRFSFLLTTERDWWYQKTIMVGFLNVYMCSLVECQKDINSESNKNAKPTDCPSF
jgi:hypothetical protein